MLATEYSKQTANGQTSKLHLAVDLRPLNYPLLTGVNIYCLHLLRELAAVKQQRSNLTITGIGLQPQRQAELAADFGFFGQIFTDYLSLSQYTRLKFANSRLQNLSMLLLARLLGYYENSGISPFDYLLLMQPKPLWKHPKTKQICIFYDIYSALDPVSTNWANQLFTNKQTYRLIIAHSHRIWTLSLSTAWDLIHFLGTPKNQIKVVYPASTNLLATSDTPTTTRTALPAKYVLAISGIEKRKNWFNLILAHRHLQQQGLADYSLVLAGRIVDRSYFLALKNLIAKLQIPKIIWVIDPNESEKRLLIQNSLFVAYPSLYEGFGFPILEAFAAHKCVLTSRISSMPEVAQNGALYVNPLNYLEIARGLQILLTDTELRTRLAQNARQIITQYDWSETRRALEELLGTAATPN